MATDIQKMRLLIPDNEQVFDGDYLFSEEDLTGYLEIAGSVLRAAGFAMIAIANSEAMISKVIRTQDLQTNGAQVADAFRRNAEVLFKRADDEDYALNGFYTNTIDYREGWSYDNPELTEWNWATY